MPSSETSNKKLFKYICNTIEKIIKKIIQNLPETDFSNNILGGPGLIIQVDETMLNYKAKSHRGCSPSSKTDSTWIVEISNSTKRVLAKVMENKKAETIIPIKCSQVAAGSLIWTDEHKSYASLV
ncbi:hypothetical protein H312_01361 [Anncaliia algerae PRA339]|uniref:ISXO2-like transposase domain-containing protein n=1 Tax=Anncaliia algerae PRA339 TaxID=1288291 RepID=A0A059F203_9MICR|nr:hypothetical protein H312_01361 [Anncaliia algerae PRA339]